MSGLELCVLFFKSGKSYQIEIPQAMPIGEYQNYRYAAWWFS
jgi:hypothetical protein